MNHKRLCILFAVISSIIFANHECCDYKKCKGYQTKTSYKQSEFNHGNDNYKLIVNAIDKYNEFHISHSLNISYEVYKNGQLINSNVKGDNTIKGNCDSINGGEYSIELISENDYIGWIIYSPNYCGATSHADWATIIIPSKKYDNYSKSKVTIWNDVIRYYPTEKGLDFYYYKQDWGQGGTWSSIYVPYKLSYDKNKNIIYNQNIEIEDIQYLDKYFLSLFMAGFNSMNKELMQYALDYHYDDSDEHLRWYESFFGSRHREHTSIIDYEKKDLRLHDCSRLAIQNIINK